MINIYYFFLIQYAAKSYIFFLECEMHNILVTKMKVCIREQTYEYYKNENELQKH